MVENAETRHAFSQCVEGGAKRDFKRKLEIQVEIECRII